MLDGPGEPLLRRETATVGPALLRGRATAVAVLAGKGYRSAPNSRFPAHWNR
jgi:hypothetical protein